MRDRVLPWLPAAAMMGLIFVLSSIPGDELPLPGFRFSDKVAHFLAYSALGFLIGWRHRLGARRGLRHPVPAWDTLGAAVGILFGLSDEVHQLFVPLRLFSWSDFAADGLGVLAGLRLWSRLARRAGFAVY